MSIEKTTQNVCKCGALVSECEGHECSINDCVIETKNEDPMTVDIKTYTFPEYNEGQSFAKKYKNTPMGKNMDEPNKKALDVMATEGMEAAVKHMFTDEQSGRQLSYSEMRSRFG